MRERNRRLEAIGTRWAIATPHAAATDAGAAAFAAGGNAIDAALAAATTLAVVYPHMCGVGGDLFALIRQPDGRMVAVNASGAAPRAIDVAPLRRGGPTMPDYGPLPVTVPGAVSGWATLAALGGRLSFADAFGRAIESARSGVPVARSLADSMSADLERLGDDRGLRAIFAPRGHPLREGEALVQPALARTLEQIAGEGPSALYGGDLGRRLVRGLQAVGSPMTLDDLLTHEAELAEPISRPYRELEISVVPPTSQGFVLLLSLLAIERLGIDPDPLGPEAAQIARVFLAASTVRDRRNADPRWSMIEVEDLLGQSGLIEVMHDAGHAADDTSRRATGDTVALVTADAAGHMVSLIQSLFHGFGSGILESETGIVLQNRGACFSLDPASPNVIAGGKRPAHTLMPVIASAGGIPAVSAGTMGGYAQPQINAQNLIRVFDLGLEPAAAIDAPRWLVGGMDPAGERLVIEAEARVPASVLRGLEASGFDIRLLGRRDSGAGHAHLLLAAEHQLVAAADPRSDGEAAAG